MYLTLFLQKFNKVPGLNVLNIKSGTKSNIDKKQEGVLAPNLHLKRAQYDRSTTTVEVRYGSLTVTNLFLKKE